MKADRAHSQQRLQLNEAARDAFILGWFPELPTFWKSLSHLNNIKARWPYHKSCCVNED